MRRLVPALLLAFFSACSHEGAPAPRAPDRTTAPRTPSAAAPAHGSVDVSAIDRSVRPGSDFFMFANGAWYAKAEIPADRAGAGVWLRVSEEIEARTKAILEGALAAGAPAGSVLQQVGDCYASEMDVDAIEARGLAPLAEELARIASIKDKHALAALLGAQLRTDVDPLNSGAMHTNRLLGLWVEQDVNDPSRYATYLFQGGLGMPDRSYYTDETPPMAALRAKYAKHIATTLKLAGVPDAEGKASRTVALEAKIAAVHATRLESEDIAKANNPWERGAFAATAPGLDWAAFFEAAKLAAQPTFIVWHPAAVKAIAALVASEPLDAWKDYLTARAIDRSAAWLPKALADESFAFYGTALHGVPSAPPRWRRSMGFVDNELGEALGRLYVEKYFPRESKVAVEAMVANLVAAFSKRIDALSWMAPSTKAKAKEKLSTLKVGIGYPDAWRDYSALRIVRGDAYGNAERAQLFDYERDLAKLGHPVDRGEWKMVPQVVDAMNMPVRNALCFPAGILVPPFFDRSATAAENYGGIGAVIGHEISHSFDNQGSTFDAQGRFANWWTPDDLSHFKASGAALAAQFSAYHPFPDAAVNGSQTLGENIADLAGLDAAYDGWQASLAGAAPPAVDGMTGDQQFFLAFAQTWQSKERDEALRANLATDVHAPARYRTLTVRNLDAWYPAFDVQPSDPLYLAPSARVRVW